MPAKSEDQRRYLFWKFGSKWAHKHHFANKGKLPEKVHNESLTAREIFQYLIEDDLEEGLWSQARAALAAGMMALSMARSSGAEVQEPAKWEQLPNEQKQQWIVKAQAAGTNAASIAPIMFETDQMMKSLGSAAEWAQAASGVGQASQQLSDLTSGRDKKEIDMLKFQGDMLNSQVKFIGQSATNFMDKVKLLRQAADTIRDALGGQIEQMGSAFSNKTSQVTNSPAQPPKPPAAAGARTNSPSQQKPPVKESLTARQMFERERLREAYGTERFSQEPQPESSRCLNPRCRRPTPRPGQYCERCLKMASRRDRGSATSHVLGQMPGGSFGEGRDDALDPSKVNIGKTGRTFARMDSERAFRPAKGGQSDAKWETSRLLRTKIANEPPNAQMANTAKSGGRVPHAFKESLTPAQVVDRMLL